MLEILLLISLNVDVGLRLINVDGRRTPIVGEVLVERKPWPFGGSVGGGSCGALRGGSGGSGG